MKLQKRSLQVGALALVCVVLLGGRGIFQKVGQMLSDPRTAAVLLYLETGYLVRPAVEAPAPALAADPAPTELTQQPPEQSSPTLPAETEPVTAFDPQDAQLVEVNAVCGYNVDVSALLQQPLTWDLQQDTPTVLILHSHGTESYQKTQEYTESSAFRTLDTNYNVVSVGEEIARTLEAAGVKVVHDKTLHDYPSYNSSYNNARTAIRKALEENPSIFLVLDIHRDAVEKNGEQMRFTVSQQGQSVAQLMMVVGSDAGGLKHPDWPENMSLAVKLHARLEKLCPGICRPISFRKQRFNQDLSPGALIVEVGSTGTTREEALAAARLLAQAVLELQ